MDSQSIEVLGATAIPPFNWRGPQGRVCVRVETSRGPALCWAGVHPETLGDGPPLAWWDPGAAVYPAETFGDKARAQVLEAIAPAAIACWRAFAAEVLEVFDASTDPYRGAAGPYGWRPIRMVTSWGRFTVRAGVPPQLAAQAEAAGSNAGCLEVWPLGVGYSYPPGVLAALPSVESQALATWAASWAEV